MPGKKTGRPKRRIYWPNCMVCQYMKKNQGFRYRMMQSSYFTPQGLEPLTDVVHSFGDPFPMQNVYSHIRRHQAMDVKKAQEAYAALVPSDDPAPITGVVTAIEGEVITSGQHETGLDEFIREGREKLARNELPITANTYLQAIKIKADIEKSTKDRRLDAAKAFFANAKPKEQQPGQSAS